MVHRVGIPGFVKSQSNAGFMYYKGLGFSRTTPGGKKWYRKAGQRVTWRTRGASGTSTITARGFPELRGGGVWYHNAAEQGSIRMRR
jgi:hypothetical protein